jgi:TorA maturation chaperone TorD
MSEENNTPTPSDRALRWRWLAAAFTYPDEEVRRWLGEGPTPEAYLSIFGHTVRGDCPPHELEYGSLHADKLYQPHLLADIAAFYRAFGLELTPDAAERVDHIAMECEFYAVLCAKEEVAGDQLEFCRETQKKFLREHLARWTPAFTRRVECLASDKFYPQAARQLRESVEAECARHGIQSGNADLQLQPVEELVDPCGACGIVNRE